MPPTLTSTCFRAVFLLVVVSILWNIGVEACTPSKTTPHPDICNQYFICVRSGVGTANILRNCPAGQNFDPSIGLCSATYECWTCE